MSFGMPLLSGLVPEGRLFALDQQMLISIGIQLLNVCILAAALGFILYKPVQDFLRKRSEKISSQLQEAQEKLAEAEKIKAEYEKKLQEIDLERVKILESARLTAAERSRHLIEDARREAAEIRQRAHESVLAERERLKDEAKLYIIDVASILAEKFVEHAIDRETQDRLFEEAVAQLEEAAWLS
ncbi:MAG: ATP synthase F0 subunit B [Oscillospiraceae bacterium]